jgi:hypothetical protein
MGVTKKEDRDYAESTGEQPSSTWLLGAVVGETASAPRSSKCADLKSAKSAPQIGDEREGPRCVHPQ